MASNIQELTNKVVNDQELMTRLGNANSAQEVSDLLKEKGINISAESIDEFSIHHLDTGELSVDDLENVAGGGSFKLRYLNPIYWVGRLIAAVTTKDLC